MAPRKPYHHNQNTSEQIGVQGQKNSIYLKQNQRTNGHNTASKSGIEVLSERYHNVINLLSCPQSCPQPLRRETFDKDQEASFTARLGSCKCLKMYQSVSVSAIRSKLHDANLSPSCAQLQKLRRRIQTYQSTLQAHLDIE